MSTPSSVGVTEGASPTKQVATYAITETTAKQLERAVLNDSAGNELLGTQADAAWDGSASTASAYSLWKYISSKLEAIRAELAGTLTVTGGAGGGGDASAANQTAQITQETAINTVLGTTADAAWDGSAATPTAYSLWKFIATKWNGLNSNGRKGPTNGSPVTPVGVGAILPCPAGTTTAVVKNGAGAAGDYLEGLLCIVETPATSLVQVKDGSGGTAIDVLPANVGGGVGTYPVPLGWIATAVDGWTVVCGAGVKVVASGDF